MTCAVNLLPESCHNDRCRAARRTVWTAVATTAGVLLACAWVVERATNHALANLVNELGGIQVRQSELDRQLTLSTIARNDLARQARALLSLRQEQALPEQLLALTNQAPDGVTFTEIRAQPIAPTGSSARRSPPPSSTAAQTGMKTPRDESSASLVHLRGYALEHAQLTRLIDVLKSARAGQCWQEVELLRAAREPYRSAEALAFQLECRPGERVP